LPEAVVTQGTTTQRYAELIGSDLALTVNQTGTADVTIANPHGDVVTTVDVPSAGAAAVGIIGWNNYDEYGSATSKTADTGTVDYGWLGAKQRAVTGAGLTLMGVRLYDPATALFTALDPVPGGNANAYTYPSDPINHFDLDGKKKCKGWRKWLCDSGRVLGWVSTGLSLVPFCSWCTGASLVTGYLGAAAYAIGGDGRSAAKAVLATTVNAVTGGVKFLKYARKLKKMHLRSRKIYSRVRHHAREGWYGRMRAHSKGDRALAATAWYAQNVSVNIPYRNNRGRNFD
jgi:RHS repeat-associated protein